jgi:cytochrome c oxidase subunit 2
MPKNLPLITPAASSIAGQSDALFFTLLALTIVFTALVGAMVAFLSIRYRRGNRVDRSRPAHHSTILELSWSVGPMFLALAVFVWAAKLFATMFGPAPKDAMEIFVIGKQWMWHLQHQNGIRENNELHIPLGKPVKLTMISQDVIHDFSIPAFRIKRDVIPGTYSTMWFTPTLTGKYHLYCAQYCGTNHSEMDGYVYVMEPTQYQQWLATGGQRIQDTQPVPKSMAAQGEAIYQQQGCGNCHDADGMNRGPSLAGIYGRTVQLRDGGTTIADDAYVRKSILDSNEDIVSTYQQIMPSYKGQLNEEQVLELLTYIRSLSAAPAAPAGATTPAASGRGGRAGISRGANSTGSTRASGTTATNNSSANNVAGTSTTSGTNGTSRTSSTSSAAAAGGQPGSIR